MDINNIAIIRATNVLPLYGLVRPISNVPYLCKNISLSFSACLSDLLHELGVIPPIDYSRIFEEGYYDEMVALSSKILKEYLPYVSNYNSMVLFSLNGICPDDNEHGFGNNIFSNKKVAIIESLSSHIDQVVSIVPTDTALKGDVVLSSDAIVMIEENFYSQLTEEQKQILHSNCFKVKIFTGSIKEAIYNELKNSGRYIPETLSLTNHSSGFIDSDTSALHKECINNIADSYGLPQIKYYNLITTRDTSMPNYDKVCDEYDNANLVQEYFMIMFFNELFVFLAVSLETLLDESASLLLETVKNARETLKNDPQSIYYKPFLKDIIDLIKKIGIENYKMFVDKYNYNLEIQQANMTLITPKEIVLNPKQLKK